MDKKTKKELQAQYKEREITGGVYVIKNTSNNKILLEAAVDLRGRKNVFEFSKATDSCIDYRLKADWKNSGGQFVFEILEELKKGENQSAEEFESDILALKEIHLEKLSDHDFY